MPLVSDHFRDNDRLKKTLVSDPHHVLFGDRGEHVALIQRALMILGAGVIAQSELDASFYGHSTATVVRQYKGPPRNIINTAYQSAPDDIVGKWTIRELDKEMDAFEQSNKKPKPPIVFSLYISFSEEGDQPHNHLGCPGEFKFGNWITVKHHCTPIYPRRDGRMVNIGGEEETKYLGFEDFLVEVPDGNYFGKLRPFTKTIPPRDAGDICMRSTLLSDPIKAEIRRIARPGCRFTYASPNLSYLEEAKQMGRVIEFWPVPLAPLPTVIVEL